MLLPAVVAAAVVYVLEFGGSTSAQPPKSHEPFANTTQQQAEMIQVLKEISMQLKEQNALLRTGTLQVTVVQPAGRAPVANPGPVKNQRIPR
jgi:hypothetical protein